MKHLIAALFVVGLLALGAVVLSAPDWAQPNDEIAQQTCKSTGTCA